MDTKQIINGLLDRADRVADQSAGRIMRQAAKRLEELDLEQKWIPVTERLPEQGQEVIAYSGNILSPSVFAYKFWRKDYDTWVHVTHWMPLPEPPKEVDNG